MTIHYHGTPITPNAELLRLAGRHFCVSHAAPAQVRTCHEIGQSVMLDNGAFSAWKRGYRPDWNAYYAWVEPWLDYPTTWAVIPDEVEGDEAVQDQLLKAWPFAKQRSAPVWHMHESIARLLYLIDQWPRVCVGSSAQYAEVLSPAWQRRMDDVWRAIGARVCNIHMLRGMQLIRHRWPFASVDSTDVARNHNRDQNCPYQMAKRWDAGQCPPRFTDPGEQMELVA